MKGSTDGTTGTGDSEDEAIEVLTVVGHSVAEEKVDVDAITIKTIGEDVVEVQEMMMNPMTKAVQQKTSKT
jgi:uncharacterized membrane protein YccF (DUF307 family)